ncbi:hypothetical protein EEB15_07020 [Ramlibacter sp. WS9]|nr:hypothetical protein EEB15_07020 [Ramlibacter sp. WS9]
MAPARSPTMPRKVTICLLINLSSSSSFDNGLGFGSGSGFGSASALASAAALGSLGAGGAGGVGGITTAPSLPCTIRMPSLPPMLTTTSLPLPETFTRSCLRLSRSPMMPAAIRISRKSTIRRHHDIEDAHWETWVFTFASHSIREPRVGFGSGRWEFID